MPVRTSEATWNGTLQEGDGEFVVGDDICAGEVTYVSRFERDVEGKTNPEELIAAAHASCFSMALAAGLSRAGFDPDRIRTTASVHLEEGEITHVELETEAEVPEVDEDTFQEQVADAEENCPVSQALAAIEIQATGRLV